MTHPHLGDIYGRDSAAGPPSTAAVLLDEGVPRAPSGPWTIERFLYPSYQQFADLSYHPVKFPPLIAERFASATPDRGWPRSKGSTQDGNPTVLHLHHNAGRVPDGPRFLPGSRWVYAVAWSGGSEPGDELNASVAAAIAVWLVVVTQHSAEGRPREFWTARPIQPRKFPARCRSVGLVGGSRTAAAGLGPHRSSGRRPSAVV